MALSLKSVPHWVWYAAGGTVVVLGVLYYLGKKNSTTTAGTTTVPAGGGTAPASTGSTSSGTGTASALGSLTQALSQFAKGQNQAMSQLASGQQQLASQQQQGLTGMSQIVSQMESQIAALQQGLTKTTTKNSQGGQSGGGHNPSGGAPKGGTGSPGVAHTSTGVPILTPAESSQQKLSLLKGHSAAFPGHSAAITAFDQNMARAGVITGVTPGGVVDVNPNANFADVQRVLDSQQGVAIPGMTASQAGVTQSRARHGRLNRAALTASAHAGTGKAANALPQELRAIQLLKEA